MAQGVTERKGQEPLAVSTVLFPTLGIIQPDGDGYSVEICVHRRCFVRSIRSWVRKFFIQCLKFRYLTARNETEKQFMRQRLRPFFYNEVAEYPGHLIIELPNGQEVEHQLTPTGKDGTSKTTIELTLPTSSNPPKFLTLKCGNTQSYVSLVPPKGVAIISDLDDTIKISCIGDRRSMLRKTFLEPFAPVTGMADLYQLWEAQGATFHYVTASPHQLYPAINDFFQEHSFPQGSIELRRVWDGDRSLFDFIGSSRKYKMTAVNNIVNKRMPNHDFILVGDLVEHDLETYAQIAKSASDRIMAIYLRDLDGARSNYADAIGKLSIELQNKIHVFKDASSLPRSYSDI